MTSVTDDATQSALAAVMAALDQPQAGAKGRSPAGRDIFMQAHDDKAQRGTEQIAKLWAGRREKYNDEPQPDGIGSSPARSLVNFMDNHDVSRFLFNAQGNKEALRNALTLLMTEEGIPCLYYGTEQELAGGNDPANREVLWNTGYNTSNETFRHFSKLSRLRAQYPALRRGDTLITWSSSHTGNEEDAGIIAYERTGGEVGDEYALVVINTNNRKDSSTSNEGKMMVTSAPNTSLVDMLDPDQASFTVPASGELRVTVGKQRARILVPKPR